MSLMFVFTVLPPFRLRVPQCLKHTSPSDDTRPPWVTDVSSPPCRPQTPWCDRGGTQCLRLHSAGSSIPHLWPTGSSLFDYDPVVLLKPFRPRLTTSALPFGVITSGGSRSALAVSSFRLRARLDLSIPSAYSDQ